MSAELTQTKAELRSALKRECRSHSPEEWERASATTRARLTERPEWRQARSVLLYVALPGEIDLGPLATVALGEGRQVALPRFRAQSGDYEAAWVVDLERDLAPGRYGIPEPTARCPRAALNQLDLALVPGVGFAPDGRRLGRGKGFYDRLLVNVRGIRCGVAADWQIVPSIPRLPHDELIDCIVTPGGWIECHKLPV